MKGQGISINAIIITALALIVLVVLVAVFTQRINVFGVGIGQATEGGKCEGKVFIYSNSIKEECRVNAVKRVGACPVGYDMRPGVYTDVQPSANQVCCTKRPVDYAHDCGA